MAACGSLSKVFAVALAAMMLAAACAPDRSGCDANPSGAGCNIGGTGSGGIGGMGGNTGSVGSAAGGGAGGGG